MALTSNMPTFTYVRWANMIISYEGNKYIIQNDYTNKMWIYWDMTSPYQLFCTNEKQKNVGNFFLIAVNEKGIATQIPNDHITISYDGENPDLIAEKIYGIYEKNKEFGDKFVTIEESIDGISQSVGKVQEEQNKVSQEVTEIKQVSDKIEASVNKVEKEFNDNLETTTLRENLNKSIIDLNAGLGIFKSYLSDVTRNSKIDQVVQTEIQTHLGVISSRKEKVILYVDKVLGLMEQGGFTDKFNSLTSSKTKYINALNNLDTIIKSIVKDNIFVPSEITMITDVFGKANTAINELKNSCDNCIHLGTGGSTSEELARLGLQSDKIILSVSKMKTNMKNNLSVEQSHIQEQVNDVLFALGNLQKSLKDVFLDGGVTEAEKVVINDNYAKLEKEKEDIDRVYESYYNDELISNSVKRDLKSAYDEYCNKHTGLKTVINKVVEDAFVNEAEMLEVDTALTTYEIVLNQFHRSSTNAINDINTNRNNQKIKEAKDELQGNINDVDEKINTLDTTVNSTFKNNVIDEAERKVITQNVKTLEAEKLDVDTKYNHLYNNKFLEGNLKVEYKSAYDNFIVKYNSLISILNGILNKEDLISDTDRNNMNKGYTDLNSTLGTFSVVSTKVIENVALKEAESIKLELGKDINDVSDKVSDLSNTMNTTFKDNVLDESERTTISLNLKNLNIQKNDIDNQYKQLYSNANVSEQLKTDLKEKYDLFLVKYNNLVSIIQEILDKPTLIDDSDRGKMNTAYEALNAPMADFIVVANKVIEDIAKKEVDKASNALKEDLKNLNDKVDNITGDIGGAIADGILDEAEKISIKQSLKMLANDKENFHNQFTSLYGNPNLVGIAKSELNTAHDNYETAYEALVAKINEILEKTEKITEEDRMALDEAFSTHSTKLGLFTTQLSSALNSITNKGIDDAKESLSNEMKELNSALTSLENTMNGVFKDGVLSEAEKIAIKQNLKNLETEKLDIDKRYLMVYNNVNLTGQVKVDLKSSYDTYILKYNSLVKVVNDIISKEGILVESDQTALNTAFSQHNVAIGDFSEKYSKAIDSITNKSIEETKISLQNEIGQVNTAIGELEGTMNGVFKDGILSDSEKLAIKQNLQSLLNEKTDIDKQYETLYANEDLEGEAKSNLKKAYDDYSAKYLALVGVINTIVNKQGIVDSNDQRNLSGAFGNHRVALGVYSTRVNEAVDAIVYKKAHTQANIVDKKWSDIILDPEKGIQATVGKLNEKVTQNIATVNGITEEIKTVKSDLSSLTIQNEQISQKVESVEKTATTVKKEMDNLQIGVRNILKDGDVPVTSTEYLIKSYRTYSPLRQGKTYTIVFKGSISEGQQFGLWYNGGSASIGKLERKEGSAIYILTFTISQPLTHDYISIYNYPSTTGKTATIEWACLYEGDVKPPLDYIKPIEDIQGQIDQSNIEIEQTKKQVASIDTGLAGINSKVESLEETEIKARKVGSFRYIRDYLNGSTSNDNNHIVELQVWSKDVNIAQGKTPTCSTGLSNGEKITDGDYSNPDDYASFGSGWQWIEIDLGIERTDIDMVKVWHYYYDGRAYNHKLMVSRDGQTWFELYNSDNNGRYTETRDGRTYLLNESYTETRLKTAEQKLTDSSIISTVSTQFYKKGETDSKYASQTQITQLSSQISSKVDVNGVKSVITQNPDLIRTTFNNISTAITMYPEGMRVWHEGKGYTFLSHAEVYQTDNSAGRKLVSLKDGGFRVYKNDADNSYLGGIISGAKYLNGNTKGFGITLANGYKSWYTSIGHNPKVYNPSDESLTGYQHYLDVVFAEHYGQDGNFMRVGTHVLSGGLDLHHLNIFDVGIIWFDKSTYDAVYKGSDGCMTIQCEDQIKLIRNSSRNEQREALRCNFISNEIQVNMNINGGGYTLYNTKWNASYSLLATSPKRSVGADTASVETMLLQEDFSEYDEKNHAVMVDMNEAVKSIYAKNKKLEDENEDLKQRNEDLKQELNMTKNALDAVLMGGM